MLPTAQVCCSLFPTLPIHEPGILHHPPSIARFYFSAPELQFQFGNLTVEGSQGPDCRVTHWGDGFLLQVSLSLGPCFFPYRFPWCGFSWCSTPHLPTQDFPLLSFSKTYPAMSSGAQGWGLASQSHHFPPDTRFTNTPQIICPASQGKALPALGWTPSSFPIPRQPGLGCAAKGKASKGSPGQQAVCHPHGTGAPGDRCP